MNDVGTRVASGVAFDTDDLNTCVGCGLCLPHCPTFRVSGEEALSPRGRIDAMRGVAWRDQPVDDRYVEFIDTCVQCRGCEPACPSQVPYGRLIETARRQLAADHRSTPWYQRAAMSILPRHRLLLGASTALATAQRLHLVPKRAGLTQLPVRRGDPIESTGTDVWLYTGCVMDAWQRDTHRAVARVLSALGVGYAVPDSGCCGALHDHAGLADAAHQLAQVTIASMPGDAPILIDSAGCGATMKEYGRHLGTDEAMRFSARVFDVNEWIAPRIGELKLAAPAPTPPPPVIVQDPCHLRHVQRAHLPVREVVGAVAEVVELDDDGLCCGAGGAYSVMEPALAGQIRDRKLAAIDRAVARSGATTVASANPGCLMHLQPALAERGMEIEHPIVLLAERLA